MQQKKDVIQIDGFYGNSYYLFEDKECEKDKIDLSTILWYGVVAPNFGFVPYEDGKYNTDKALFYEYAIEGQGENFIFRLTKDDDAEVVSFFSQNTTKGKNKFVDLLVSRFFDTGKKAVLNTFQDEKLKESLFERVEVLNLDCKKPERSWVDCKIDNAVQKYDI